MKNISTVFFLLLAFICLPYLGYSQTPCENYDQSMAEVEGKLQKYPIDYNQLLKQLEQIKADCPEKATEVDAKIEEVSAKKQAKFARDKAAKRKKEAEMARKQAEMTRRKAEKDRSASHAFKAASQKTASQKAAKGTLDKPAPRMSSTGIYDNFPGYVAFYTQGLDDRNFEAPKAMRSFPEENGVIEIDICIDKNGTVVSAKVDTENSNITTVAWHEKLITHAKKFIFNTTADPNQCGSIRYLFKKI
jgi:hypothetical protein